MTGTPADLLVGLVFLVIWMLPVVYFRAGTPNLAWLLTAAPVASTTGGLLLAWSEVVVNPADAGTRSALAHVAVVLSAGALFLFGAAIGANRQAPAMWHQPGDQPSELVTWGAYAWIRHPFYAGYLLAFGAAVCVAPMLTTIIPAVWGAVALAATARREEGRLLHSPLGPHYSAYAARTGRFVPRVGRLARSPEQVA